MFRSLEAETAVDAVCGVIHWVEWMMIRFLPVALALATHHFVRADPAPLLCRCGATASMRNPAASASSNSAYLFEGSPM